MNYLIIDLSYYTFYRFFATKQWYKHANSDETFDKHYNWSENTVFWDKFSKMFVETLNKYVKKFKIDKVILAKDCPRKEIWRMDFYDSYKSTRENDTNGVGNIFKKTYAQILPTIIDEKKIRLISFSKLEADDIIYLTKLKIQEQDSNNKITIISSDHDLLQLIDENVTLMDAKMKSYNDKSHGTVFKDVFMKSMLGDSSDNIQQCFPKRTMGQKTAIKSLDNISLLLSKFKEFPGSFDKFVLNHLLIDFTNIPQYLVDNYNKNVVI